MVTPRPHPGTDLHTAARRAAGRLRRLAAALAAVTCALLASAVIVPAASAGIPVPPGGPAVPAPAVRVVTAGGMAGWQIAVIAAGAALAAAIAAVVLDRARAARKTAPGAAVTRPVWP
jgi:NaMN:DMB phosphoribosyltransferase